MDPMKDVDLELPRFRIKRSHKKSRLGCITCKRRRVKCDEKRPCCDRCRHRGVDCAYDNGARRSTSQSENERQGVERKQIPPDSLGSSEGSVPSSQDDAGESEVPDAFLVEHYLDHTIRTFAETGISEEQLYIWRVFIPALAYSSEVVRRGMLTLAAICLHYHTVSPGEYLSRYLSTAEHHGQIFVRQSRKQLLKLDPSELNSVLASSRLLCVLGFAFNGVHRRNGATLSDNAAWTWLQLLRGVQTIHDTVLVSGYIVNQILAKDMVPNTLSRPASPSPAPSGQSFLMSYMQTTHQARFDALKAASAENCLPLSAEQSHIMLCAVDVLEAVASKIYCAQSTGLFRLICAWPCQVSKEFVDQLLEGSSFALVIYAHWLMLVAMGEELWWVNDMGRAGIREVLEFCSKEDRSIQELLKWPQQVLTADTAVMASSSHVSEAIYI